MILKNFLKKRLENYLELIVQVLRFWQKFLLDKLEKGDIFDQFQGCIWICKYQKWGLQYNYLLLFFYLNDCYIDVD